MIGRTREERKIAARLRAELALKHAFERIDHAEDVVKPILLQQRELAATNNIKVELEEGEFSEDHHDA
jgi:hypothetical protein